MSAVLVVNSGSSSLKYRLIDAASEEALASGLIERIGEPSGQIHHTGPRGDWEATQSIPDHTAAFRVMLDAFGSEGPSLDENPLAAVGHRVVHGGKRFFEPTIVTDLVEINIEDLSDLAPLHNPANLQGIRAARKAFPDVEQVAVFDTAFHQTLAPEAYTYAIDAALAERHRVRRYGFHGTSHKYVSGAAAEFLGRPLEGLKQIVLHLGNGASVCAIDAGRSVDTSMGMTPLEGLVMGTRSGDLDPAVLLHLARRAGLGIDDLDELLNRRSGLLGLSGHGDMRDVRQAAESGDAAARLALDTAVHRLKHYIGAYTALLGGLDVLTFTAGIGENDVRLRAEVCAGLEVLGIRLDPARNRSGSHEARLISADDSRVAVLVVPTDEEREIARQSLQAVGAG
ncbi:acetate/propionate family kinase [Leifsonia shinshuensis]